MSSKAGTAKTPVAIMAVKNSAQCFPLEPRGANIIGAERAVGAWVRAPRRLRELGIAAAARADEAEGNRDEDDRDQGEKREHVGRRHDQAAKSLHEEGEAHHERGEHDLPQGLHRIDGERLDD